MKSCKAHCDIKCKVCSKCIYFRLFQAERERDITVEHLADIDRLVNESLQMLSRFQDLNTKILPLMEDYLIALRSRDNTPASLLRMDKQHEEEMINNYTSDIKAKIQGTVLCKDFWTILKDYGKIKQEFFNGLLR